MPWTALVFAGLFEIVWAVGLKYTEAFTRLYPSLITVSAMAVSFLLLSYSLKTLPIGTAYTIWTGIGAVGTVIFGIAYLGESTSVIRLVCITLIIIAMLGLKLSSSH